MSEEEALIEDPYEEMENLRPLTHTISVGNPQQRGGFKKHTVY